MPVLFAFTALGCGVAEDILITQPPVTEERVESSEAEIINGDAPISGTLEALGPVTIRVVNSGVGCGSIPDGGEGKDCSGTLVTNQHVYTAKHCTTFDAAPYANKVPAANVCVYFASFTSGSAGYALVEQFTISSIDWDPGIFSTNDQAMLTLSAPAVSLGSDNSMSHRVVSTVADQSVVYCLGSGLSDESNPNSGGTLRTAYLTVSGTGGMTEVLQNARGQRPAIGDSGSTCFPGNAAPTSISPIMGVLSYGFIDNNYYTPTHTGNNTSKPFVDGLVLAPAAVKFSFVPSMSGTVPGTVSVVDDSQSVSLSDSVTTTLSNFAPRSTWVSATADATSAGYACPPISLEHAPLTGTANLSTTCLSHALISVLTN